MDITPLWQGLTRLVAVGLRSFALTLVGMVGLGLVLAAAAFWFASQATTLRGILATLAAMTISTALGFAVAGQRAIAIALLRGLREQKLGSNLAARLFDHLLAAGNAQPLGKRGGTVVRAVERLPLAQAEALLNNGVSALLRAPEQGGGPSGWLRRRLQGRLLRLVHVATLARFRDSGTDQGGIDLRRVRDDLANQIDARLIAKVRGTAVRLTAGAVALAVLAAVAIVLALQKVGV